MSQILKNLQLVVNFIGHFYFASQKQLVLSPLPEVTVIAHEPTSGKWMRRRREREREREKKERIRDGMRKENNERKNRE